jgi:hypothetical protein
MNFQLKKFLQSRNELRHNFPVQLQYLHIIFQIVVLDVRHRYEHTFECLSARYVAKPLLTWLAVCINHKEEISILLFYVNWQCKIIIILWSSFNSLYMYTVLMIVMCTAISTVTLLHLILRDVQMSRQLLNVKCYMRIKGEIQICQRFMRLYGCAVLIWCKMKNKVLIYN